MFSKEKFNYHPPQEGENIIERHAKEILKDIGFLSEDLNKEKIPVDEMCRINMKSFIGVYSPEKIKNDEEYITEMERKYARKEKMKVEDWKKSKNFRDGERFEQIKTIIFNRNFKDEDVVAVRASKYDDYKNSVDNVIINKKTGDIICALDEIAVDKNSEIYKEKEEKIKEINKKGGAELEYGITFEKGKDEKPKPVLKKIEGIKIFILSLSPYELREAIEQFGSGDFEKKLFRENFGRQAREQLQELLSYVSQPLKKRWMDCF